METAPAHWYDDSVALSAAVAELEWLVEHDLLTDGDREGAFRSVEPMASAEPVASAEGEPVAEVGPGDWSVEETLARVAATPPGPQPIRWLTSLDGLTLTSGQALTVAGEWERQARWVVSRQQGSWVGFVGPVAPGPLGPDGPTQGQLRRESSNLLELSLTIDAGVDYTRDKADQARLLAGTLSATGDRLAAGELSDYRARLIAEQLRTLDPVTAQQIEAKVLGTASKVRVPSLIRRLRRLVLAAQGPAAVQAHQAGLADRRVVVDSEAGEVGLLGLHAYLARSRPSRSASCSRRRPSSWPGPTGPPATRSSASTGNVRPAGRANPTLPVPRKTAPPRARGCRGWARTIRGRQTVTAARTRGCWSCRSVARRTSGWRTLWRSCCSARRRPTPPAR